jgi:hypothetical protein
MVRAPAGVSIPSSLQYPGINSGSQNLPELPPLVQLGSTSVLNLSSVSFPTTVAPTSGSVSAGAETSPANLVHSKPPTTSISGFSPPNLGAALSTAVPHEPTAPSHSTNKPASLLSQNIPQVLSTVEQSVPLVTPGQLLQTTATTCTVPPSTLPVQTSPKEVQIKAVEVSEKAEPKPVQMNKSGPILSDPVESKKDEPLLPEPPIQVAAETREPLLPSPMPTPYKVLK